ncbi:MAG TPA: histidine phosphatase family protein, partial [Duganella sp.]|nr:histidine phosphatase family protein [Duganella sp.]
MEQEPTREQKWPDQIWLVRHGQSAGNVARDAAEAASHFLIDIAERDVDVALSELGQ